MPLKMLDLQTAQQLGWNVSIFLRAFLLCLILFHRNIRSFPFFTIYLVANLVTAVILLLTYHAYGTNNWTAYFVAWGSQTVMLCLRALAVAELCRLLLGRYRGIWSLAWRVLLSCAVLIVAYAWIYAAIIPEHNLESGVIVAGRALELSMAAAIVVLFVFLRHYEVASDPSIRSLALGFFLYSCVSVINFTVLEKYSRRYEAVWSATGVFSYLVCLFVWGWALRKTVPRSIFGPSSLFAKNVYERISPEVNARLRALNEQLSHFWNVEAPRS